MFHVDKFADKSKNLLYCFKFFQDDSKKGDEQSQDERNSQEGQQYFKMT